MCVCSSTWHDGLHASVALGGVLVAVALDAHQHVLLGGKRPLHQRTAAFDAQEAFAVPVAVFVGQILQSRTYLVQLASQGAQNLLPIYG